ncbi:MAG TPA: hypothetical protein VD970_12945 [Acetobacteraceae bacterium]|nr:hypothetical protein [Acetobacteraceae bacterium]
MSNTLHPDAQPMTGTGQEAELRFAEQVIATQRRMSDMTLALANEVMGFATRRLQAQVTFIDQLTRCSGPAEMVDAQFRFVAEATNDYAAEIGALTRVIQPREH